jgi:hypothetical protein
MVGTLFPIFEWKCIILFPFIKNHSIDPLPFGRPLLDNTMTTFLGSILVDTCKSTGDAGPGLVPYHTTMQSAWNTKVNTLRDTLPCTATECTNTSQENLGSTSCMSCIRTGVVRNSTTRGVSKLGCNICQEVVAPVKAYMASLESGSESATQVNIMTHNYVTDESTRNDVDTYWASRLQCEKGDFINRVCMQQPLMQVPIENVAVEEEPDVAASSSLSTTIIAVIVVAVVAVLVAIGYLVWKSKQAGAPISSTTTGVGGAAVGGTPAPGGVFDPNASYTFPYATPLPGQQLTNLPYNAYGQTQPPSQFSYGGQFDEQQQQLPSSMFGY